jgi:hypothetical protein
MKAMGEPQKLIKLEELDMGKEKEVKKNVLE